MIRRVTEYIIVCDGDRVLSQQRCEGHGYAYGSPTMADCAGHAADEGWLKLSARLWLCPKCAKAHEEGLRKLSAI